MQTDKKIVYVYAREWKAPSLGMTKAPKEGNIYKAFIEDGKYLIDVMNEDEVMECVGLYELEDKDWKFEVITPDNIDEFELNSDQLAELSGWMEKEEELVKKFYEPIKIVDEEESEESFPKYGESKYVELEIFQPNISEGINIFVDALLNSSKHFQETETDLFYEKYTDALLQDGELGKGGAIIAMNNALMGYMKTDSIKFLHNIAYHCMQEIKRRDNLK